MIHASASPSISRGLKNDRDSCSLCVLMASSRHCMPQAWDKAEQQPDGDLLCSTQHHQQGGSPASTARVWGCKPVSPRLSWAADPNYMYWWCLPAILPARLLSIRAKLTPSICRIEEAPSFSCVFVTPPPHTHTLREPLLSSSSKPDLSLWSKLQM